MSFAIYVGLTDKGRRRTNNEDSILISEINLNLLKRKDLLSDENVSIDSSFIIATVADGVGGLEKGEIASDLAVKTFNNLVLTEIATDIMFSNSFTDILWDDKILKILMKCLKRTNEAVLSKASGGGTTLTSALIFSNLTSYIVSVGDSRCYVIWPGEKIYQITYDQSIAWKDYEQLVVPKMNSELVHILSKSLKENYISEWYKRLCLEKFNFLKRHSQSHVIWNVIGYYGEISPPSIHKLYLDKDSILLLCSDGLTDEIDDVRIYEIISDHLKNMNHERDSDVKKALESAASSLIMQAKESGGRDNISVILIMPFISSRI